MSVLDVVELVVVEVVPATLLMPEVTSEMTEPALEVTWLMMLPAREVMSPAMDVASPPTLPPNEVTSEMMEPPREVMSVAIDSAIEVMSPMTEPAPEVTSLMMLPPREVRSPMMPPIWKLILSAAF